MTPPSSVLGVLGWCWVGFGKPTQVQAPDSVAWRVRVLGVLGLRTRARRRAFLNGESEGVKNLYARFDKPNTPNTLNTVLSNPLNSLGCKCVGFVLGRLIVCWVSISEGWR